VFEEEYMYKTTTIQLHKLTSRRSPTTKKRKEQGLAFIFWGDLLVFVSAVRNSFTTARKTNKSKLAQFVH